MKPYLVSVDDASSPCMLISWKGGKDFARTFDAETPKDAAFDMVRGLYANRYIPQGRGAVVHLDVWGGADTEERVNIYVAPRLPPCKDDAPHSWRSATGLVSTYGADEGTLRGLRDCIFFDVLPERIPDAAMRDTQRGIFVVELNSGYMVRLLICARCGAYLREISQDGGNVWFALDRHKSNAASRAIIDRMTRRAAPPYQPAI